MRTITYGHGIKIDICTVEQEGDHFLARFPTLNSDKTLVLEGETEDDAEKAFWKTVSNDRSWYDTVMHSIIGRYIADKLSAESAEENMHAFSVICAMATAHRSTRADILEGARQQIEKIEAIAKRKDFKGMLAPNQRFVDKAIWIIKHSAENICMCDLAFDKYGFRKSAFLISKETATSKGTTTYTATCPRCNAKYEIEETYIAGSIGSTFKWKSLQPD